MVLDEILNGDCLTLFSQIPDGSIDLVLTDLPFGVTCCSWDKQIDLDALWSHWLRVTKPNAAIVLMTQEPFTSTVICSRPKLFRYRWTWEKTNGSGHLNAKKRPMKVAEDVCVFYRHQPTYNPQMETGKPYRITGGRSNASECYRPGLVRPSANNEGWRYPRDVLRFNNENKAQRAHPTQKPVALCEYFIRTYTNPGEVVLDNCLGSGTTAVAAKRTGRHFIGIEQNAKYCEIARQRLALVG